VISDNNGIVGVDSPINDPAPGDCACGEIDPGMNALEDWIQWEIPWKREGEHMNRLRGLPV